MNGLRWRGTMRRRKRMLGAKTPSEHYTTKRSWRTQRWKCTSTKRLRSSLLPSILMLSSFWPPVYASELSDYEDCTGAIYPASQSGRPLSKAERLHQLDGRFVRAVSETDRCNKPAESSDGGGGAMSANASSGGQSLAVNSTLSSAASSDADAVSADQIASSAAGKAHEELDETDNQKAVREQLEKRVKEEKDPEIRKSLLEKIESLK